MLHACLIIYYDIGIMTLQLLYLCLYNSIYKAVTSLSLGSPITIKS